MRQKTLSEKLTAWPTKHKSTELIGIIGIGMVGGAMKRYFASRGKRTIIYDKYKNAGSPEEINKADVIFVCVPTPFHKTDGFDLSMLHDVCRILRGSKIVILKSTMLPGTTEAFQKKYSKHAFLCNPEFLTEATADNDMRFPHRQILGYTKQSFPVAKIIMAFLPKAPFQRILPANEAEMIKMFSNTWYAVKVSFANQIYDLCQKLNLDYERIRECAAADPMIGPSHLAVWHKGYRGYGGKCLPKDMKAFISFAKSIGIDLSIHKNAEKINAKLRRHNEPISVKKPHADPIP